MLVQVFFLMFTILGLIDEEVRSFLFLSLVWFGIMAWDFKRDFTHYRKAGHGTYCVFRQSILNACYRNKGFPAPGDR
jgi:hypothetical protein